MCGQGETMRKKDKEGIKQDFNVLVGRWWRFQRYELRDGIIRPVRGAKLAEYDPWKEFYDAQARYKDRLRPYTELVNLVSTLGEELACQRLHGKSRMVLSRKVKKVLLDWCNRFGLLGVLLQRTFSVVLAPRWKFDSRLHEMTGYGGTKGAKYQELWPTLCRYNRSNDGWTSISSTDLSDPRSEARQRSAQWENKLVQERDRPQAWPRPGALILKSVEDGEWRVEPLSKTWAKFFPDVKATDQETYWYPKPLTESFWRAYAEPLDMFYASACKLASAIEMLPSLDVNGKVVLSEHGEGVQWLNNLHAPNGLALEIQEDGSVRQKWMAFSLIEILARMASLDLTKQRSIKQCRACGNIFAATVYRTLYCSTRCRTRTQKQVQRTNLLSQKGSVRGNARI
jgi:hypothetical protein